MGISDGPHLVRRKARRRHAQSRRAGYRAALDAGVDGKALAGLLAHERRPTPPEQSGHTGSRRENRPELQTEQQGRAQAPDREVEKLDEAANKVRRSWPRMPR